MILYSKDPPPTNKKLLEQLNEFSKAAEHKTNTKKSVNSIK